MSTIKNALLYVKNIQDKSPDSIDQHLLQQPGVSRISHSERAKGLVFVDYQPKAVSMTEISQVLGDQGVQSVIIDM